MRKLAVYLKKYRIFMILGPVFKLIEAVFELIVPLVVADMIDNGVRKRNLPYVYHQGTVLLILAVVGLCSALVCQRMASYASQGFGTSLRSAMYEQINRFSHKEIDAFGTPSLITRITNDVNQLQVAVAMLVRLVIRAPFLAIGSVVMAISIDWKLGLIFLVATPLIGLTLYLIMSRSVPYFRVMQKKLDQISLVSREGLSGVRVIRAFAREKTEEQRFDAAADEQADIAVRVGKLSALLNPATYLIMNFSVAAILWFGGTQVNTGSLTQGQVMAFVNYMSQTLLALMVVANLVVVFTKASASATRVTEVLETVPAIQEKQDKPVRPVPDSPKAEFREVSFSYDGSEKYALENVSLRIERGQTIGVIGGTGCGKSTLVSLIPRLYEATKGQVLVDGVPVQDYPFAQLRRLVGVVPQEARLFSGTIRSNLCWRKADASEAELQKALRVSQAAEFVSCLPQGLDSPVEAGGKNFSGGQRQRLTIARALVGEPQILILDDSASALDFATDAALRRAIREETRELTVILVSQRANTIRSADRIVVLDEGCVAGTGTHAELMQTCAVYREICLSQMSREEAGLS
ncbi:MULTISPECIES: ABC transporter ATP-binding protein [Caproicibacterium]|uniref:ABC transporter ATP-binding protein n=1 Tax=Caproicibacterium argilliputei TaxID=3030016 RepID=A0AA97H122_9FIRM|nr:ABC transporter ATP-binding protein [Caproicibacterium argilliputei]WOC31170.1 ABC transporter ATP-binding protein [Caproicibacterium argilliputei]